MTNLESLKTALAIIGAYQYQNKSSYADNDAQRNLEGKTHYVDSDTLKYFKSRILRGQSANNGLFYVLQESLPHPDYGNKRIRRNVLFDVFGNTVNDEIIRDICHLSTNKADSHYYEIVKFMDSKEGFQLASEIINKRIERELSRYKEAAQLLITNK